jgi:predicted transcriptional regulator
MEKTTVYLPEELKHALERTAAVSGRSEAELIREGVALVTRRAERPRPRGALFASGLAPIARRVDDELDGFGED